MDTKVFEYQLRTPLLYSVKGKGEKEEIWTISLNAPTMNEYNESGAFGQMFAQAYRELEADSAGRIKTETEKDKDKDKTEEDKTEEDKTEEDKTEEDEGMTAQQACFIFKSSHSSVQALATKFKALAKRVIKLDESGTTMKDSDFNKLSLEDFEGMMYGYASYFTLPSLFRTKEEEEARDSQEDNGSPS